MSDDTWAVEGPGLRLETGGHWWRGAGEVDGAGREGARPKPPPKCRGRRAAQPGERRGSAESEAPRSHVKSVRGAAAHTPPPGVVVTEPGKEALS